MTKTLIAATAAALAFASAPASAGIVWMPNGTELNGMQPNGIPLNGIPLNGIPLNGIPFNGLPFNGLPFNGIPFNGSTLNGGTPEQVVCDRGGPAACERAGGFAVKSIVLADGTKLQVR